jgi:hypothetical protein
VTAETRSVEEVLRILDHGDMEILGLLRNASNYTFLSILREGDESMAAVYKPRRGERPLWDFPEGTLCRREVAAYEVASTLGWPDVPPTVLREGPEGEGSVQMFVDLDPEEHFYTMADARLVDFVPVAVFDAVVNNADRKSGHCLLGTDGRIWVIDHGVCFSPDPKLRTVIWDFAGEEIPSTLLEDVSRIAEDLRSEGSLHRRLSELLAPEEIAVTAERAESLSEVRRFPLPGPERPYPWPPV